MVTGTGVVTPIGNDVATFWSALKEGKSGVGPLRDIDFPEQYVRDLMIQIACQVKDFDPKARIKNRLLLMADRYSQFAGAAAAEAFAQSKLEIAARERLSLGLHHRLGRRRPEHHRVGLQSALHQEPARQRPADAA